MGRFWLYFALLALAVVACVAVARDRSARAIDLEYHFPDRPPADEIVRGIELALEESGGRAGPYRVTAVRGKSPRERALRLPGFKPVSSYTEIPVPYPVDKSWDVYAIPPRPDAEKRAILAWMKAIQVVDLLVLHGGDWPEAEREGIRVSRYPDDPKPERPSLVILASGRDPAVQFRSLRAEGYAGPVLMHAVSFWDERFQEMEGVFVCLAPRKAAPESFVREYLARSGSEPTACAYAGYFSCAYALRALAAQPLLPPEGLTKVYLELDAYDPWRDPVGEARVCEFRGGIFRPWTSNR